MWQKISLFLIVQIALVMAPVIIMSLSLNTTVITKDGQVYNLNLYNEDTEFIDSKLFSQIMEDSISEIAEYAVIKTQIERNGVYDGKKEIDISAYVNRKNSSWTGGATAVFYLEDLLKWYKYGLNFVEHTVPVYNYEGNISLNDEEKIYYNSSQNYSIEQPEQSYLVETFENVDSEIGITDAASDVVIEDKIENTLAYWMYDPLDYNVFNNSKYSNYIEQDEMGEVNASVRILECRYPTVDGSRLQDVVYIWEDYFTLCNNLDQAIAELYFNYSQYLVYQEKYLETATNIKFCMGTIKDGKTTYVSNLSQFNGQEAPSDVDSYFKENFGKYIYYYPSKMKYETNTNLMEDMIFKKIVNYEYVFPENTQIWIGIDTNFPNNDTLSYINEVYRVSGSSIFNLGYVVVICIFALICFIILCVKAGWILDEEQKPVFKLNAFDCIPLEIVLALAAIVTILGLFGWNFFFQFSYIFQEFAYNDMPWLSLLMVGTAFFFTTTTFCAFFLSLVRRIKGHNLWKDSLFGMLIKGIQKEWKRHIIDSNNYFFRVWIPYLLFLVSNLFCLVCGGILFFRSKGNSLYTLGGLAIWGIIVFIDLNIGLKLSRDVADRHEIIYGINRIGMGEIEYTVVEENKIGENRELAEAVNTIGDGIRKAVETSMKDERLKADLITNVSHDIKTPLTSIINYVDLLKREKIEEEPMKGYIEILDSKSQRLKQLTEDLVEASKISSGNISYIFETINLNELINQAIGEFDEKFSQRGLSIIDDLSEQPIYIEADSRRIWRVIENLFNNIYKYAMENTRVYLDLKQEQREDNGKVRLSIKNISTQPLNINADELTERFIRGDVSRNTEGSGLGLSIAKNLTEAQKGKFEIYLDGDLFKVTLTFPIIDK